MADACEQMHRFYGITFYICFRTSKVSFLRCRYLACLLLLFGLLERESMEEESSYSGLLNPCLLSSFDTLAGLFVLWAHRASMRLQRNALCVWRGSRHAPCARQVTVALDRFNPALSLSLMPRGLLGGFSFWSSQSGSVDEKGAGPANFESYSVCHGVIASPRGRHSFSRFHVCQRLTLHMQQNPEIKHFLDCTTSKGR